jgi:hypothetical protein
MNKTRNVTLLVGVCLLALAMPYSVLSQDKKSDSLTGTWDCIAHLSGEDDIPFTMTLEQKSDAVTGSVTTHEGDLQITSGSFKNGVLELHLENSEAKYVVTGKLDGDQFKGQWSKDPDGMGGNWEGKKPAPAASSSK